MKKAALKSVDSLTYFRALHLLLNGADKEEAARLLKITPEQIEAIIAYSGIAPKPEGKNIRSWIDNQPISPLPECWPLSPYFRKRDNPWESFLQRVVLSVYKRGGLEGLDRFIDKLFDVGWGDYINTALYLRRKIVDESSKAG